MAILLKVEIRLKIVNELHAQAMSPRGFFDEFGGGSVERVAQHFAVLEEHAWLTRTGDKRRKNGRRGRAETLYRTTELPFLDPRAWSLLPYSVRLAFSWGGFMTATSELREGLEDAVFKGYRPRKFTCMQLELDEVGWGRSIARLGDDFHTIFEEQTEAEARAALSGVALVRSGILQLAFESPNGDERDLPHLATGSVEPPISFVARTAPIFADELSMRIVAALNRGELSVRKFHQGLADEASEGAVRYRFQRLRDLAWITETDQITQGGAPESLYRATRPSPQNLTREGVPDALRRTESWRAFMRLSALAEEALLAGTFDAREDRHLSWSIVNLDAEGWRNVTGRLNELTAFVREEETRARGRIADGAKPLTMVVGLTAVQARVGMFKAP